MGVFRGRPFALSLLLFILPFLLVYALALSDILTVGAGFLYLIVSCLIVLAVSLGVIFVLLAVRIPKRRIGFVSFSIAMLFVVAGLLRSATYFGGSYLAAQRLIGEKLTVTAVIRERESSSAGYSRYRVTVRSVGQNDATPSSGAFDAALVLDTPGEFAAGDSIGFTAECCSLSELYLYPSYAIADGCFVGFLCEDSEEGITLLYEDGGNAPLLDRASSATRRIQHRLSYRLSESLGGEVGAFASAVLLGDRSGLSESTTRDFGRAGISHLLALSGLHMSVLIGGFAWILRKCGIPRRAVSALTILAIFGFLLLTGFSMSACRAGLMLGMMALLGFFSRSPDPFTSLFLSVAVVLLVVPSAVASIGLWMSFSSVLGLLVLAPRLKADPHARKGGKLGLGCRLARFLRAGVASVGISLIASFSILPILYISGGEFSLFGVLTNLLTVFLMPSFLALSLVFLIFGRVVFLGSLVGALIRLIGGWILAVARIVSLLPNATVALTYPFVGAVVMIFVAPTLLLLCLTPRFFSRVRARFLKRRRRKEVGESNEKTREIRTGWFLLPPAAATILYCVCLFIHLASFSAVAHPPISVIHHSSGGELLTVTDGTSSVLVDLSEGYYTGYCLSDAEGRRNGCTEWSSLVLTQYRLRHLSSVPLFCRSNLVREVLLPNPTTDREVLYMESLIERLVYYGISYDYYEREEAVSVTDSLTMTLSDTVYLDRSTQPIFALTLSGEETLVYLTQSIEESALSEYAEELIADAEILLYGSRGPKRIAPFTIPVPNGKTRRVLLYGEQNRMGISVDTSEPSQMIFEYDKEVARLWEDTAK